MIKFIIVLIYVAVILTMTRSVIILIYVAIIWTMTESVIVLVYIVVIVTMTNGCFMLICVVLYCGHVIMVWLLLQWLLSIIILWHKLHHIYVFKKDPLFFSPLRGLNTNLEPCRRFYRALERRRGLWVFRLRF